MYVGVGQSTHQVDDNRPLAWSCYEAKQICAQEGSEVALCTVTPGSMPAPVHYVCKAKSGWVETVGEQICKVTGGQWIDGECVHASTPPGPTDPPGQTEPPPGPAEPPPTKPPGPGPSAYATQATPAWVLPAVIGIGVVAVLALAAK